MDYDYILDTSMIKKYRSDFEAELNSINKATSSISSSFFAKCTNPKVSNFYFKIYDTLNSINNTMSLINNKWIDYISDIETLENQLAAFDVKGADAPIGFKGEITKIVDGIVDSSTNGKLDYSNLGYKLTADLFFTLYNNKNSGQCVEGFKDFCRYIGIYDELYGDPKKRVHGNANSYYLDENNRKKILKYFDLVEVHSVKDLQDGDWLVNTSGKYGHICMYYQGKAFGKNQRNVNYKIGVGNPFTLDDLGLDSDDGYYGKKLGKSLFVYRLKKYSPQPIKEGD